MPPELGNLKNLTSLRVDGISGEIPPELGNLVSLLDLHLAGTRMEGEIPQELGNLVNLVNLKVSSGELRMVKSLDLSGLVNLRLKSLSIDGSQWEIPPSIGEIKSLWTLTIKGDQTGTIPPELGNLTNLEWLSFGEHSTDPSYGDTRLNGEIPPELGNLVNLTHLKVSGELIGGITVELTKLGNLQTLILEGNQLMGDNPGVSSLEKYQNTLS